VRRRSTLNVAKAAFLVLLLGTVAAGLGWLVGAERGAALFGLCSLLAAIVVYVYGDRTLLGMLGARPFAIAENPLLRSTIDRLSTSFGVAPPRLYLLDDGYPRAFVVGRGPFGATLAVSTGLLRALPPAELEAVLAHELAHVRSRDVLTQTFAVLLASVLMEASRIGGWLSRALLFVLAPVAAAFTHLLLSQRRELDADADAAQATDPAALADALLRLDRAAELVEFSAPPATEPLYTLDPFAASDPLARMFRTHPPLERRLERLREMVVADAAQGGPSETARGPERGPSQG
jgi:heat shock protein HtpX